MNDIKRKKTCPVCAKGIQGELKCQRCGYDASLDYENYRTLSEIPHDTVSLGKKTKTF